MKPDETDPHETPTLPVIYVSVTDPPPAADENEWLDAIPVDVVEDEPA